MKFKTVFISALFLSNVLFCNAPLFANPNEDKALDEISKKMLNMPDKLKGKRICMFKFTSIEGRESPDGARISQNLLERLMNNGLLRFVDRTELAKIVGEQELEQAGLVDRELTSDRPEVLPVDLMITGTFARINNRGYIHAKVLDAATSEIYIAKSVEYDDGGSAVRGGAVKANTEKDIKTENINGGYNEAVGIFKRSPEQLDRLNRAFFNLNQMSEKRPLVFLMTVLDQSEIRTLQATRPRLAAAILERREQLQRNEPRVLEKVANLRKGLFLMKDSYPSRYDEIMNKKNDVIKNMTRRR